MKHQLLVRKIVQYFKTLEDFKSFKTVDNSPFQRSSVPCVSTILKIGNSEYIGHGQAENINQAAFISVIELLERYLFDTLKSDEFYSPAKSRTEIFSEAEISSLYENSGNWIGNTTNGFSIHDDYDSCIENSINELIERHTILKAQALAVSPALVNASAHLISMPPQFTYTTYVWRGALGRYVCVTEGATDLNSCFGFACKQDIEQAIKKSIQELAPRLNVLNLRKIFDRDPPSENPNFNTAFSKAHDPWLKKGAAFEKIDEIPGIDLDFPRPDIWVRDYKANILSKLGLHACQALSPLMQPLFVGDWNWDSINLKAMSLKELPMQMHIVG